MNNSYIQNSSHTETNKQGYYKLQEVLADIHLPQHMMQVLSRRPLEVSKTLRVFGDKLLPEITRLLHLNLTTQLELQS